MGFDLQISAGATTPIFRQIIDQVRLGVATGRLAAGEQLPSVRALAEKLVVNPNTIAKAYNELSREGVIDSQQGRGVFVSRPRQIYTKAERTRRLEPLIDALVHAGISLGFTRDELLQSLDDRVTKLGLAQSQGRPT
jgi:GntR family transcriptional regulator